MRKQRLNKCVVCGANFMAWNKAKTCGTSGSACAKAYKAYKESNKK